ncbi:MAG: hypothetical protein WCX60_01605 [Anaerovoracaceae bacterium]
MHNKQRIFKLVDELLITPGTKIIAVDGNSGAGKTFLGSLLAERYDCNLFHMDDYYLPPEKKTDARLAEAGGNVDRERFQEEVLDNIPLGVDFSYRKYDCRSQSYYPPTLVSPKNLNVVEGAYSMHPDLAPYYDLKLFLSLDEAEQSRRILKRNGALVHKRFLEVWIPLENHYFETLKIRENCDYVFTG